MSAVLVVLACIVGKADLVCDVWQVSRPRPTATCEQHARALVIHWALEQQDRGLPVYVVGYGCVPEQPA